jgi:hypothetical protein
MLDEFRLVHEEMEAALANLDALTSEPLLDETRLASARLKLSRASGKRRRLVDAATVQLLDGAAPSDARKLRALRELNAIQLEVSTRHIGTWGLRQIAADWPGYCHASVNMRQSLRELIAADRETLYPLLGMKLAM